ncbi:beta and beta-prime subunits of DNA dependent RNA-polymerase [Ramaria rubella]|nr:beta and beta-prime subunits of DNA dependent RNA-polymerase [Ramaria rubella]
MNIANSIPSTVSSISFSFLSAEDIRRISVKQLTNPVLLDDLNRPNIGGLYDPALGPADQKDLCGTCRLGYFQCPGHFGHIELPAPVYHPLFMINMYNLLRGTCLYCHKFKTGRSVVSKYAAKLKLLDHGLLDAAKGVDDLQQRISKSSGDKNEDDEDDEGQGSSEGKVADETEEEFIKRVKLFVAVHLHRASSSKRGDYKDNLVYQTRKEVITDFLKSTILKSCQNDGCGAPAYTFRKEGHTKIIEYDLTPKQKALNAAAGRRRGEVLLSEKRPSVKSNPIPQPTPDSDEETGSEEDIGGDEVTDDDPINDDEHRNSQLPRAANGKFKTTRGRNERVMAAEECRAHLRRLFRNDHEICSLLYGRHGPFAPVSIKGLSEASADIFFLEVMPVSPTRFRPPARMGETLFEHPQNELLTKILTTSYRLRDLNVDLRVASTKDAMKEDSGIARTRILATLLESLVQLQVDVNSFIDSSKNPTPMRQGKLPPAGVKQGLEKKEGLFRMHMMGKRVNYAARSVISPDVNIEPNEIGIPPVFARKLTFPEPVTQHNFRAMRDLVIRGTREYPGASMVEYEDGHMQQLDKLSLEQRTAIANQLLTPQEGNKATSMASGLTTRTMAVNKKVHRHLRDGDTLILNRQPTLHKPSMMAHKARVLLGEKTIRMHYANCNSYNEMNIHFPQNEVARAEASYIANTDNQYLVPTSGKPLRGLIQDHVVAGLWMTAKSSFFTREEYNQLLYGSLRPEDDSYGGGRLITLPPTIWKPKALWTGKQIISTVLKNITPETATGLSLRSESQVPAALWGEGASEEGEVLIFNGELLCGILDKSQIGASAYGLVHSVHELFGADVAGRLLGILSRLFTKFLQHRAFTCRMDDLVLTDEGNQRRKKLREDGRTFGTEAAIDNFPALRNVSSTEIATALNDLLEDVLLDDQKMADLDRHSQKKMREHTRSITDACIPHGLLRRFPDNHMQAMTISGAKGSSTNAQLISCGLGQQSLEGRRVPVMISGKTLPSFKAFETAAIAGGYIGSRFLTGIRPQEFYFHCMAGREGLIDTAVKTSRSGYLQRCLIKHLEGICVHYDHTVRGSDSSVYQFHYGGDGIDVTKQKHLYEFEFAVRNEATLVNRTRPKDLIGRVDDGLAMSHMKKALKKADRYPPTLSLYSPSRYLGSTSERFARAVNNYVTKNPDKLIVMKRSADNESDKLRRKGLIGHRNFRQLMNVRYLRSLVDPGEAVGLLASQGVGEPSTQMTLNTFHLAGHGAANVTLGIPRLREIVMTASTKPKTPNMTLPVVDHAHADELEDFCKRATRLTLSQLVEKVLVKERLCIKSGVRTKEYTVNICFFPVDEYQKEYHITPAEVLDCFGTRFAPILRREIILELKRLDADIKSQSDSIGKGRTEQARTGAGGEEGEADEAAPGGNGEESEVGDGDADDVKRARQSKQQATYDNDSDDEVQDPDMITLDDERIEEAFRDDGHTLDDNNSDFSAEAENLAGRIENATELFMKNLKHATSFSFEERECFFKLEYGSDMPKLLLVGVIERTIVKTVVREITNVKDCFLLTEDSKDGPKLMTNGSNYLGMWLAADHVADINNIYSNDIYATLRTYGVEMARASIVREMRAVFHAYSINVDDRHLELIADYMTFDGGYKPFNRRGISSNSSPLLKASFETTASFISDAALYGDFDDLTSPSGRIILGRPSTSGTASFDIMMPVFAT